MELSQIPAALQSRLRLSADFIQFVAFDIFYESLCQ